MSIVMKVTYTLVTKINQLLSLRLTYISQALLAASLSIIFTAADI